MDHLGLTQSELSRRAGVNRAFVSDLMRGSKTTVREESLMRLARALGTSTAFLVGATGDPKPIRPPLPPLPLPPPSLPPRLRPPQTDEERAADEAELAYDRVLAGLPPQDESVGRPLTIKRARARAGTVRNLGENRDGEPVADQSSVPLFGVHDGRPLRIAPGAQIRDLPRPPMLGEAPGAYAVIWPDNSLEPRIRPGEIVYCAPTRKIRLGDEIAVTLRDQTGAAGSNVVIGRASDLHQDLIVLSSPSGGASFEIPASSVRACHLVVLIAMVGQQQVT
jgi:transcriptional regulator with XRE-family HTH domain